MAKDFDYARAQTRTYLDEATQADWKDAEIDREVNNGYHEVVSSVMTVYEDFYLTSVGFDTVANQQEYGTADGLPTNMFKLRRLEVNFTPATENSMRVVAKPATLDDVNMPLGVSNPAITPFQRPTYYLIGGGSTDYKVGFLPIPTSSGPDWASNNNCKLWYIEEPEDLLLGGDLIKIPYPDRYAKLIARYAAGILLSKGQQEEKNATNYMVIYNTELNKMQEELEDRVSDGAKHVIDTAGEDIDFSHNGII